MAACRLIASRVYRVGVHSMRGATRRSGAIDTAAVRSACRESRSHCRSLHAVTPPTMDLLGSFFPAWMLCAVIGIVAAVIIRQILVAAGINDYVVAPLLTYVA